MRSLQGDQYDRRSRKLLHVLGGLLAFVLPFIPYWLSLLGGIGALLFSLLARPSASPWLNAICKPEDRARGTISGLRGYAVSVLILLLCWPLLELREPAALRYVMFGWMALAFGDGLAGLIGPGPKVAATVPWNPNKTWWGVLGSFIGFAVAYWCSFGLTMGTMGPADLLPRLLILLPVVSLAGAVMESLDLPVDDNYVVGLSAPVLALLAASLL
jgi:dolichol kinase